VKKVIKTLTTKNNITYTDKVIKWNEFIRRGKNAKVIDSPYVGDALVAITYTGGTTGLPKGVMMTNDSMNSVGMNFIHSAVFHEDGDRFLGIIPIFAAYGMVCGMHMPLCMRMTLVPIPRFVPTEIGKLVKVSYDEKGSIHLIEKYPLFSEILHNNAYRLSDCIVCGTRGWFLEEKQQVTVGTVDHEKICQRELGRLKLSLEAARALQTPEAPLPVLVFLHFPPLWGDFRSREFLETMEAYGVRQCFFGHIHGFSSLVPWRCTEGALTLTLVASDALSFTPLRVFPAP
jgi:acyl-CoA synthetase (AMP-forming)/AMP-acid ligase II